MATEQRKHSGIKREMTSSRETGEAAGIHIILCGLNNSLIEIKTHVSLDRILKRSVKGKFLPMEYCIFKGNINTQKI